MTGSNLPDDDDPTFAEYPGEDVEASRRNQRLQRAHDVIAARKCYEKTAKLCPKCGSPPQNLAWFYFESPPYTWENLCGCAGWMTVCDACHVQVDFFEELLN